LVHDECAGVKCILTVKGSNTDEYNGVTYGNYTDPVCDDNIQERPPLAGSGNYRLKAFFSHAWVVFKK
jgi:hypothetical protein